MCSPLFGLVWLDDFSSKQKTSRLCQWCQYSLLSPFFLLSRIIPVRYLFGLVCVPILPDFSFHVRFRFWPLGFVGTVRRVFQHCSRASHSIGFRLTSNRIDGSLRHILFFLDFLGGMHPPFVLYIISSAARRRTPHCATDDLRLLEVRKLPSNGLTSSGFSDKLNFFSENP